MPTITDALATLQRSHLLGQVPEAELRLVAERLELLRFQAGETIIREGDPGERCYLVRSGTAGVRLFGSAVRSITPVCPAGSGRAPCEPIRSGVVAGVDSWRVKSTITRWP